MGGFHRSAAAWTGVLLQGIAAAFLAFSKEPDQWRLLPLEGKRALVFSPILLCALDDAVEGEFRKGDVVEVCDRRGAPLARGLVNFSSDLCQRMKGRKTADIEKEFGALDYPEVIHRDNLVVPPA